MCERGYHGIHPWHCGAKVSGVGEIVVTKGLLKLFSHLLEVSEITGFLNTCGQMSYSVPQSFIFLPVSPALEVHLHAVA